MTMPGREHTDLWSKGHYSHLLGQEAFGGLGKSRTQLQSLFTRLPVVTSLRGRDVVLRWRHPVALTPP
jgi:hypothetical protein